MTYVIEKNVPMPQNGGSGPLPTALRAMQVGDSVVIPVTNRPNLAMYAKRLNAKFATRTLPDRATCRVWRTA